jgi:hypothetical protein
LEEEVNHDNLAAELRQINLYKGLYSGYMGTITANHYFLKSLPDQGHATRLKK